VALPGFEPATYRSRNHSATTIELDTNGVQFLTTMIAKYCPQSTPTAYFAHSETRSNVVACLKAYIDFQ